MGHHKKAIKKQRIGNALIESSFSLRCKVRIEENTPLNCFFFSKHLHTFEGFLGIAVAYTINKNPRVFISNRSKENLFQSREEFLFEAWNFIVGYIGAQGIMKIKKGNEIKCIEMERFWQGHVFCSSWILRSPIAGTIHIDFLLQ